MSKFKSSFVVAGLVMLGAAACSEPAPVDESPTQPTAKKDAGRPRKKDAGVSTGVESSTAGDDDESAADDGEEGSGDESEETTGDEGEDSAGDKEPASAVDAGRGKDAGPVKDAGLTKDAGGGGGTDAPGPCPAPYMCQDPADALKSFGAEGTVTDPDDKPLTLACSKGSQETCDPKDPKKSCPNLPNAFCAHVVLTSPVAIDLYNCAQLCTP
jgi:hypothetical protein